MEGKKRGRPEPTPGLNALELREGSPFQQDPCLSSEGWHGLPGAGLLHGMHMSNYDKQGAGKSAAFKNTRSSLQRWCHSKGETVTTGSQCRHTMSAPELHPLYRETSPGLLGLLRNSLHGSP